jgi:hypothetical protein
MTTPFSRRTLLALAAGTVGPIIVPRIALGSSNRIVNYSDGVALVDQYGNILERIKFSGSAVTASGGGQSWSIPINAGPGFTFSPVPGVTIRLTNNGVGQYSSPHSSGSSQVPQQVASPISTTNSTLGRATTGYTPDSWPTPGGKGGPQPFDASCIIATVNFLASAILLGAALASFLDGPILWGADMWALLAAGANCSAAEAEMQLACSS